MFIGITDSNLHFFSKKIQENLVMSEKCSNFARFFADRLEKVLSSLNWGSPEILIFGESVEQDVASYEGIPEVTRVLA